jgi:hypothetical protein
LTVHKLSRWQARYADADEDAAGRWNHNIPRKIPVDIIIIIYHRCINCYGYSFGSSANLCYVQWMYYINVAMVTVPNKKLYLSKYLMSIMTLKIHVHYMQLNIPLWVQILPRFAV